MIDALVTGRSVPALLAALDLAEVGLRVAVAADADAAELPAAPVPDPDGVVAAFLERVAAPIPGSDAAPNPAVLPQRTVPQAPYLQDRDGNWAPQSTPAVLGVPASPLAAETIRLLGTGAAVRAYLDRVMPLLTVGKTREFGSLVRKRLGEVAVQRLVEPEIRERFGVAADAVEVAVAAPGLNEALSRVGSLTAAVLAYADRNVARETRVTPTGGGAELKSALLRKLEIFGVDLLDLPLSGLEWQAGAESALGGDPGRWMARDSATRTIAARAVVFDFGRSAERPAVMPESAAGLAPTHARIHAVADIHAPAGLPAGCVATSYVPGWSVRIEVSGTGAARAHLVSDVALISQLDREVSAATVERVLHDLRLVLAPDAHFAVGIAAAPFATVAAREAAEASVRALAEQHHMQLLAVGRSLYGDDLAVALHAAHVGAVALRRHVTGIAD